MGLVKAVELLMCVAVRFSYAGWHMRSALRRSSMIKSCGAFTRKSSRTNCASYARFKSHEHCADFNLH